VSEGRASGVRLTDGSWIDADAVISTSSTPETVFQLLGGRYDAAATNERLERWTLFPPIVLASFGIALPLRELPQMMVIDDVVPFDLGGVRNSRLSLRICNEDDGFAPPGHSIVQPSAGRTMPGGRGSERATRSRRNALGRLCSKRSTAAFRE
jgi:hypothetical protein